MAASNSNPTTTEVGLVIERVFEAPRELVWRAWTDPEQMVHWWGPKGFTAPVIKNDFRVGGKYLYAMLSPDFNEGRPIWSTGAYLEIVPQQRIVATDCFADEHGNIVSATHYGMPAEIPLEMMLTATFEDLGGKTKLTLNHAGLGQSAGEASVGWNESLDKLAALLA